MALKFKKKEAEVIAPPQTTEVVVKPGVAKKLPSKTLKKGEITVPVPSGLIGKAMIAKGKIDALKTTMEGANLEFNKTLEEVMPYADGYDREQKIILDDGTHLLKLGEMSKSTQIIGSMKDIHEKLGDEVFYAIAKVGIADLKDYLTPGELEKFVKVVQEGARSKKFIKK